MNEAAQNAGRALALTVWPRLAFVEMTTWFWSTASSRIGRCFVQIAFPLDQSKSMIDQALVRTGSIYPLLLHGMMIVDLFIW